MFKEQNKRTFKIIIGLIFILTLVNMIVNYFKNKEKQENIYNVMDKIESPITLKAKAYFIFDEFVVDPFENVTSKVQDDSIIRSKEKVIEVNNNVVNSKIKDEKSFLDQINSKDKASKNNIYENLYEGDLSKINLNFVDSLNEKGKFLSDRKKLIDSITSNDSIVVDKTGFYISKLDGYESLLKLSSLNDMALDIFNIQSLEKDKLQTGLKYVNNKIYYCLIEIENIDKYVNLGIRDMSITFDKKEFFVSNYQIKRLNNKNYLLLTMHEGIEKAIKNRVNDVVVKFNQINTLVIPKKAVKVRDGQEGVYTIDSGIVEFAPIKVIYEKDDMAYILTNSSQILSQSYLDLVEKNNKNLAYDQSDKNYIKLREIGEFSSILLDLKDYKVGDRY